MKLTKGVFESCLFWFLTPILSALIFIINIYKKDKYALIGVSVVFGALSFVYIPLITDDRMRHYKTFYDVSKLSSLSDFFMYIDKNSLPDFVVYFVMYLVGSLTSDPRWIYFIASTITTGIILYVYSKVCNSVFTKSRNFFFFCFIVVVCTFSYPALFSGLRFYFASSFVLLAWYFVYASKSMLAVVIFFVIAVFSHFSTVLIVLSIIMLYLLPRLNYKIFFYGSFLFTLISGKVLFNIISFLPLGTTYLSKAGDYLNFNDVMIEAASTGFVFKILMYIKLSWIYIFLMFILFKKDIQDKFLVNFVFLLVGIRNIFSSSPTILQYYDVLTFTFATFYVIQYSLFRMNRFFYVFSLYVCFNFSLEIYKYRNSFIKSNFRVENLTSASLFWGDIPQPLQNEWK